MAAKHNRKAIDGSAKAIGRKQEAPNSKRQPEVEPSMTKTKARLSETISDRTATRRKTSKVTWKDGDQAPEFTAPAGGTEQDKPSLTARAASPAAQNTGTGDTPPSFPSALQTSLAQKYDLRTYNINSGNKIQDRVTQVLKLLRNNFNLVDLKQKPAVVALIGRAKNANKLISIVEIVKRELDATGCSWFQYSGIEERIEAFKENEAATKKLGNGRKLQDVVTGADGGEAEHGEDVEMSDAPAGHAAEEDDEEGAFELHRSLAPRDKVRAVPILTIYMSHVEVPALRELYGEQASGPHAK